MKNLIPACLALLAAGLVGYILWPSTDAPPPLFTDSGTATETEPGELDQHKPATEILREEAKSNSTLAASSAANSAAKTAQLELTGRVVDEEGQPVENAEVGLYLRESMESIMRGGFSFRRMGRGNSPWNRLTMAKTARTVRTDSDGRFGLSAKAFGASTLDVAVTHNAFAPTVERLEWQQNDGILVAKDIVLAPGGTLVGSVVDQDSQPVEGASVRYLEEQSRRGRGFGRRGSTSTLDKLLPEATTDADGHFELVGVPLGKFKLLAEAKRYLSEPSKASELVRDQAHDELLLQLELGARITGTVVDSQGRPVARAQVEGSLSTAIWTEQRNVNPGSNSNPRGGNRNRGGSRDWRALAERMQRQRQTVETNAKGEFDLDTLPHGKVSIKVTHPRYIDETKDPIETAATSQVEFTVVRRLAVQGIVVDAGTGTPIEEFGISARQIKSSPGGVFGAMFGRGNRGSRNVSPTNRSGRSSANRNADRDAERMAKIETLRSTNPERAKRDLERLQREQERRRERTQRAEARDSYNKNRLGASGEVAGTTPEPSQHAGGRFLIEDLQPGEYVFDIGALGHVKIAAGPLTLKRGQKATEVVFEVRTGTVVEGTVRLAGSQTPIANADVELFLPPYNALSKSNDTQSRRAPWMSGENLGQSLSRTRTDSEGRFALDAQLSGNYALRVLSAGKRNWVERNLQLNADLAVTKLDIEIGVGSVVHGQVTDLERGKTATVVFKQKDGDRMTAKVDPATGGYEISGLAGGEYYVTVELKSNQSDWRRRVGAMARQQDSEADLILGENQELRYDLSVEDPDLGRVTGFVNLNAKPAKGFEVRLQRDAEASGDTPSGSGDGDSGRNRMRWMRAATLRASVDDEGSFAIKDVPAGVYMLEVQARRGRGGRGGRGRRGGGGGSALHREQIVVQLGGEVERRVDIFSGGLALKFTIGSGGKAPSRARASMVLNEEGAGRPPAEWRKLPSYQRLNLRNGKIEVSDMKVGLYLISVEGNGFEALQTEVEVNSGEAIERTLELKVPAPPAATNPGTSNNAGR